MVKGPVVMLKWNPWSGLEAVKDQMDRMLRDAMQSMDGGPGRGLWAPPADVLETAEALTILVELPGMTLDQVALEMHGRELWVYGERRLEKAAGGVYQTLERPYGPFGRAFALPDDAVADAVSAALREGLLTITVPRRPQASSRARTIAVD